MFQKILYPTDFSDVAAKAIDYIKELKNSGAVEVVVLHVIDDRGSGSLRRLLGENEFRSYEENRKEETEKMLEQVVKELEAAGLKTRIRIETGIPVREILRVENEEGASVLVIGSHGVSNLQEIFLGSVSEKVIRKSKNPVFVIKR
jgi:nucleotide-binding universal stress UspA family protein